MTKTGGGAEGASVAGENRVIIHLQLTDWPDRAAPGHAGHLVQLVQLTHVMLNTHSAASQGPGGPLLVHCRFTVDMGIFQTDHKLPTQCRGGADWNIHLCGPDN